jgi:nucleotide-binding universal stress UspA family protein
MTLFNEILWPTDFSDPSYAALGMARELAMHHSAELILAHVIAPIPVAGAEEVPLTSSVIASPVDAAEYRRQMEQLASESMETICAKHVPDRLKPQTVIAYGHVVEQLLAVTREADVDLIVMATTGSSGIKGLLFGSVAYQLVKRALCPVLTVRVPDE